MTIKDIAAELGIAPSTVSRVLNSASPHAAGAELRQKILDLAAAGGYTPDLTARALRTGRSTKAEGGRIFCIPATSVEETANDPFYREVIQAIQDEARLRGCRCQCVDAARISVPSGTAENTGAILIGRFRKSFFEQVRSVFGNTVYICMNAIDVPADGVICDGYTVAQDAVNYLVSLGHRNIGFLGTADDSRLTGFLDTLEDQGLACPKKNLVYDIPLSIDGGYAGMCRLIGTDADISAVYCSNDVVALGAMQACRDHGVRIPEDCSLIGTNDIASCSRAEPPLTTMSVPMEDMARFAVETVVGSWSGRRKCSIRAIFPSHLVERESCARRKRRA